MADVTSDARDILQWQDAPAFQEVAATQQSYTTLIVNLRAPPPRSSPPLTRETASLL